MSEKSFSRIFNFKMLTMKTKLCFYYKLTSMIYIKKASPTWNVRKNYVHFSFHFVKSILGEFNSYGCVRGIQSLWRVALKQTLMFPSEIACNFQKFPSSVVYVGSSLEIWFPLNFIYFERVFLPYFVNNLIRHFFNFRVWWKAHEREASDRHFYCRCKILSECERESSSDES